MSRQSFARYTVDLNDEHRQMHKELAEKLNLTDVDVFRRALELLHAQQQTNKNEEKNNALSF